MIILIVSFEIWQYKFLDAKDTNTKNTNTPWFQFYFYIHVQYGWAINKAQYHFTKWKVLKYSCRRLTKSYDFWWELVVLHFFTIAIIHDAVWGNMNMFRDIVMDFTIYQIYIYSLDIIAILFTYSCFKFNKFTKILAIDKLC